MNGDYPELRHTMSLPYLAIQIEALESYGFPKSKALGILGINPARLNEAQRRIDVKSVESLFESAEAHLGDPHIGLRIGLKFRIPTFGQTGAIYAYCNNIKHVIEVNSRYQRLAIDVGDISYCQEKDGKEQRHFLQLTPYYEGPAYYKHIYGMIAGAYISAFQWLGWSAGKDVKSAYFPWPQPKDMTIYDEIYNCGVFFSQPQMRVEFHPECIDMQLSMANPEKLAQASSILEGLLQSSSASESFQQAVEMTIRTALGLGVISHGTLAKRMNMSERELRQKLKKEGLSYRHMLDDVRKELFQEMFSTAANFSAISQELGYNDQAAFNRAFKRWYGMSPTAYSKAQSKT